MKTSLSLAAGVTIGVIFSFCSAIWFERQGNVDLPASEALPAPGHLDQAAAENSSSESRQLHSLSARIATLEDQFEASLLTQQSLKSSLDAIQQQLQDLSTKTVNHSKVFDSLTIDPFNAAMMGDNPEFPKALLKERLADLGVSSYNIDRMIQANQLIHEKMKAQFENSVEEPSDFANPFTIAEASNQALREEVGDTDFDRYLFGTGQPNRVVVGAMAQGSQGKQGGLKPGDLILSYNGKRIFSPNDLMSMVESAHQGTQIPIRVKRVDNSVEEVYLPGGSMNIPLHEALVKPAR